MLDLDWAYCTISEKSKANAERLTSCLPRLKLLSRMQVFGRITLAGVLEVIVVAVGPGSQNLEAAVLAFCSVLAELLSKLK